MKKTIRKSLRIIFIFILVITLITTFCNWYINSYSDDFLYDDITSVPSNAYGLVLGTSRFFISGDKNLYFEYRLEAATELLQAGKIKSIIVSGDNREKNYNEPLTMKNELLKRGVPDSLIILDNNGFRTYNSIVGSKQLTDNATITIISQRFHNERAIFIAKKMGVSAIGFNAKDIGFRQGYKVRFREYFAKVKAILDLAFEE